MDPRRIVMVLVVVLGLSGCVTKENYNAQVLRTNNFQRLLSEEEKRTVDLSTEVARLKDEKASMEVKNKALTAQLNDSKAQVVRSLEEVGRLQDEIKQARGGFSSVPALRGPTQEPPDRLGELQERPAAKPDKQAEPKKGKATAKIKLEKQGEEPPPSSPPKAEAKAKVQTKTETEAAPVDSFFRYHKVKKGETLAGIAKQYRTDAQTLRELNDLASGDAVRPGDRLIVGQKQ